MRMKRGTDHTWQIIKYKGDIALYAKCKCGFYYHCSRCKQNSFEQEITYLYRYCPHCGARKKWMTDTIKLDKSQFE